MHETTYNRIATACLIFAVGSTLAYELSGEYRWLASGVAALTVVAAAATYIAYHLSVPSVEHQAIVFPLAGNILRYFRSPKSDVADVLFRQTKGDQLFRARLSRTSDVEDLWSTALVIPIETKDYAVTVSRGSSAKRQSKQRYFRRAVGFSSDVHLEIDRKESGKAPVWSKLYRHKQRTSEKLNWLDELADEEFKGRALYGESCSLRDWGINVT